MNRPYSQLRASIAVAKASLLATFRSPTSVVFSLLFPIIFIVVFGAVVDVNEVVIKIAFTQNSDTSGLLYKSLMKVQVIHPVKYSSEQQMYEALSKAHITAILDIEPDSKVAFIPHYRVRLITSNSSLYKAPMVQSVIDGLIDDINKRMFQKNLSIASVETKKLPGRAYRPIDFILPGQLGFSLLMAGVFGSSFLFFSLRQSHVLKRFFATPVKRTYLIIGEMLSRLYFQVIGFAIMVALGYFVFDFTLVNGFFTFLEMLFLSLFGLIIFMGIGFIVSGVTENESSIAPIANTITLPQILLCGLFFPVESYPSWLQFLCNLLPLTFFVDGLRKIAFEGAHIWQMPVQLTGLFCWSVIISIVTIKVFRWE